MIWIRTPFSLPKPASYSSSNRSHLWFLVHILVFFDRKEVWYPFILKENGKDKTVFFDWDLECNTSGSALLQRNRSTSKGLDRKIPMLHLWDRSHRSYYRKDWTGSYQKQSSSLPVLEILTGMRRYIFPLSGSEPFNPFPQVSIILFFGPGYYKNSLWKPNRDVPYRIRGIIQDTDKRVWEKSLNPFQENSDISD